VSSKRLSSWCYVLMAGAAIALAAPGPASAVPACPISYGSADDAKPNKLYLYYPTAADSSFPEFSVGSTPTSPAQPFDVSQLTSYSGTADQLRNAANDIVVDSYCEFNVQVRPTTTAPPTTFPRRAVVAIGTDDADAYGQVDTVDTDDATAVGYARVWGGEFQDRMGPSGTGALHGANSTLQRWARAFGGTTAHEAGHSYGLSHTHGATTVPGEDAYSRHIMPAGPTLTHEQRVGYRRHFSDTEFSVLASNAGLSIQTMHNWDLVNPNSTSGRQFRLTFLSTQPSIILSWSYAGNRSPWVNPTVSGPLGTQTFRGTTYNRYQITWSTPQSWSGGSAGQVPGGGEFHVGATFSGVDFNQPDPIIITNSELLDASGSPLSQKPRLPGYDSGTLDASDGSLDIDFTNFSSDVIEIRNVVIRELPRVMSIDSMVPGARIRDPFGEPFAPWAKSTRRLLTRKGRTIRGKRRRARITVARMREPRHVLERVGEDCAGGGDNETGKPDAQRCVPGFNASLFPATTLFVRADVIKPRARVWDRKRKRFVRKSLRSRVYYQIGGRRPDLNENGVDDAIDIAFGGSRDANEDGVPDEAQG
jgi:hypothetical protein